MRYKKEIEKRLYNYNCLEPGPWKNVIDSVLMKYKGTEKGELIRMKYFTDHSDVYIFMHLHISERTFYSWIGDIIRDIELMAAYERLICPGGARYENGEFEKN